jgi:hypothetical protein
MISQQMVTHSLQQFLEANCSACDRAETRIIYEFPKQKFASLRRFQENLEAATLTSRSLPRLLTVGLVASLEYHLNLIMKEIAARNPEAIFGRDKTLPVREAVKFESMEELKEYVINDEIDKAQRDNFEAQVNWIISKDGYGEFQAQLSGLAGYSGAVRAEKSLCPRQRHRERFLFEGERQIQIS